MTSAEKNADTLVDIAGVCAMLDIGTDQLWKHRTGRSTRLFPEPAQVAGGGRHPLWRVADVEAWAAGRPVRGRPPAVE